MADPAERQADWQTQENRAFEFILMEKYKTEVQAGKREKFLKNGSGKEFLKSIVGN
jgi:predicted metal-dependent peptidase